MTTTAHPITVPGPPVTLSVSVGQVVAYLERTGGWFVERRFDDHTIFENLQGYLVVIGTDETMTPRGIEKAVEAIAKADGVEPEDVLRDMAAMGGEGGL